jgi:energy-coupling factor transport system permease protein
MPRLLYAFALEQQSPLTRLHPMTWVAIAVSFSICALVTLDPVLLTLLGMLLLGFILLGRLPLGNTLGVLTVVLPLTFFITLVQTVAQQRDIVASIDLGLFQIQLSRYGFLLGLVITLRVLVLALTMTTFFTVVNPVHLTKALYDLGMPFKYAYAFTLALRFLPLVLDELETINNAQKSRGYDIDRTNVIVKPFRVFPLMVPLVLTALRRAGLIALAMDLRGFHATPERSFYFDVHRGPADLVLRLAALALAIFYLAIAILPTFGVRPTPWSG